MTPKPQREDLQRFLQNHTNIECAKFYGVSVRTICRWRTSYELGHQEVKYFDYEPLSKEQHDLLTACLLGDGGIDAKQNRFRFGQKADRLEYVDWIFERLKPYTSGKLFNSKNDRQSWRIWTTTHTTFGELRQRWYRNNQKIVPQDLKLTPFIFAHWIVQDGTNNQPKRSFRISTDCFSVDCVSLLIKKIEEDLGIKSTLNFKQDYPVIHIGAYEYLNVIDLIKPHVIWPCFCYKLDISKMKTKTNEKLGAAKLNKRSAKMIRTSHMRGNSIKQLSLDFKVSVRSIYNILNNLCYPEKDFADVNVIYNV